MNTETKKTAPVALTIAQLEDALNAANASYIARNGNKAVLNEKTGLQDDIERAFGYARSLTEAQLKEIVRLKAHERLLEGLKDASNTKKPMRTLQALLFILTGSGSYLTGSAKTFLLAYCGAVYAGAKNTDGLKFCVTLKGDEHTSDAVYSTAKARKIVEAFGGKISEASYGTQKSASFGGKGGAIGVTLGLVKSATRGMPEVDTTTALSKRLHKWVCEVTDQQLDLVVAQANAKARK